MYLVLATTYESFREIRKGSKRTVYLNRDWKLRSVEEPCLSLRKNDHQRRDMIANVKYLTLKNNGFIL